MKENDNNTKGKNSGSKINRKKAIKKMGITALTATSLVFLQTKAGAADSKNNPARAPKRGR
jgi:hypothetical protein